MNTNTTDHEVDWFSDNAIAEAELMELESEGAFTSIKVTLDNELDSAVAELNSLKDRYYKNDSITLLKACEENVMATITNQFGLASLLIKCQDGGNVTTTHNFEKGVTSSASDAAKYEKWQAKQRKDWQEVRKETGYDRPLAGMRKKAVQTQDKIISGYTNRELPKDERAQLDHVVSAKEIESREDAQLFMDDNQRSAMATNDRNLAWCEGSANQSKGDQKMEEWLDKKSGGRDVTNEEHFGIDRELAMKKDREARRYINTKVTLAAAKKYTQEILVTGGKDAAKMAAYAGLGIVMRELASGVIREVRITFDKRGTESWSQIYHRFKQTLGNLIAKLKKEWKDILSGMFEQGLMAFLSNIVVFLINLFFTTLKRIVKIVRAGFVSLCQAVKILINPPEEMPKEDVAFEAGKVLVAGIVGATSLGLGEAIEKGLYAIPPLIPLLSFPIPALGTIGDVLSTTIGAVAGGLLTTIALYLMDACRSGAKRANMQIQMVRQSGVVVECQLASTWVTMEEAYRFLGKAAEHWEDVSKQTQARLDASDRAVMVAVQEADDAMAELKMLFA